MENRYDKYKDSGIAWIGEIPEHWEVRTLKTMLSGLQDGTHGTFENIISNYLLLSAKNITDNGLQFSDLERTISENDYKAIVSNGYPQKGDILLCCVGTIGRCCIYNYDKIYAFQRSVSFLRTNKNESNSFLLYLLRSQICTTQFLMLARTSAQSGIYLSTLANLIIVTPSLFEQQSIAAYLDQKCGEIDELITLQEEMITKLQSYKQSVITEAVTKGLDKNVPLKDSGIEWIGMIPEHWEVKRLKNLGYLYGGLTGKTGNDFNVEEGDNYEYFIPFTNIFNNMYVDMNLLGKVKVSPNEKQNKVIKNDILSLMSSEDYDGIGKSSLCKENHPHPLYLNSFCKGLRVENKFKSIFLNYFMNSAVGKYFCQIASNGFIRINLRQDKLLACPILCPPLPEQQSIADYLDQRCSEIDELISIKQQKIEKLKEYKKSLIFECVTGKRKVS